MKSRKRTVLTLTHHMGEEELKEKNKMVRNKEMEELK